MWIDNVNDLKNMVLDYFLNLFECTPTISLDHWNNITHHLITQEENDELTKEIGSEEIWKAVKNIKVFKASGRDLFQAIFYIL